MIDQNIEIKLNHAGGIHVWEIGVLYIICNSLHCR